MGYAHYTIGGMERGYGVDDICNADGCESDIDRGMSFLCYSCTKYFCGSHLTIAFAADGDTVIKFDCFAGYDTQCCKPCAAEAEAEAKAESEL